jgi:hypothetical protein
MTVPRRPTRKPLALLFGIGILVLGHSATQDSPNKWTHALPLLLILILGELVREWTAARLTPLTDEGDARRRQRLLWLTLTAGLALIALPIGAVQLGLISKFSLWPLTLLAAGIVCLGVSSAIMLVRAQTALDESRAQRARDGLDSALESPGPLARLAVFAAAVVLFTVTNATFIERLLANQAIRVAHWTRLFVSALLCFGLAFLVLSRMTAHSERAPDTVPDEPRF